VTDEGDAATIDARPTDPPQNRPQPRAAIDDATTRTKKRRDEAASAHTPPRRRALFAVIGIGLAAAAGFALSRSGGGAGPAAKTSAAPPTEAPDRASVPASATAPPVKALPADSPPADPASCMQQHLPPGAFGEEPNLGFVCEMNDLWAVTRKLYKTVAQDGKGDGMTQWVHLTRYELAAIAILRGGCCPASAAFTAAVPPTECGKLTERLVAVGDDPNDTAVAGYDETIDCLIQRQVHTPEPWGRVARSTAREHFDAFVARARQLRSRSDP
jgi:hypothetical protein